MKISLKNTCLAIIFGNAIAFQVFAAANDVATWSYSGDTGPNNWGQLSPAFSLCGNGQLQSPINITGSMQNATYPLNIHYHSAPLVIINTGHDIQVNFSKNENISFNGIVYHLTQFHFHTPSENELQGKAFPAEIHFVQQTSSGNLAVIAVFVQTGPANSTLQEILDHLPTQTGVATSVSGISVNPFNFLPAQQNYYYFLGSLTTPPCTQGVDWFVMENPISASPAQINALTKAVRGHNARPIQPLNGRDITTSIEQ